MNHYYNVEFTLNDETVISSSGSVGLVHSKTCNNTTIKTIIKRNLVVDKKHFDVVILRAELISEEEAVRCFGNNIINVKFKSRLVR